MLGTIRNALPHVRLVSLVRSCYAFLLSCYLGGIVIVQPFLQKNACSVHKKAPTQTTSSLANETSKKCLCGCFLTLVCFTLEFTPA
jgi:hypothetical protein